MKNSLTGSHKKVATKFLELGARIHSLLEESMMSTSVEREEIQEEEEEMGKRKRKMFLILMKMMRLSVLSQKR